MTGVLSFFDNLIQGFSGAWSWLTSPYWVDSSLPGGEGFWSTPLELFTISGLTLFVGLAVAKWLIGIIWG